MRVPETGRNRALPWSLRRQGNRIRDRGKLDRRAISSPTPSIDTQIARLSLGMNADYPTFVNQLLTTVCHAMGLPIASVGSTTTGDLDAMLKA